VDAARPVGAAGRFRSRGAWRVPWHGRGRGL